MKINVCVTNGEQKPITTNLSNHPSSHFPLKLTKCCYGTELQIIASLVSAHPFSRIEISEFANYR